MIGKISTGKSLGGCLKYCLNDKVQRDGEAIIMKDRAEVIFYNQCGGNEKELLRQFNDVRQLNPKLSKPVLHVSLSLAPGEQLTKDKWMDICEECARDLKFENSQYVTVLHHDTAHQHLHIVVNRVGLDGRTVSDSQNYQKIARLCRKMEQKHDLQQVLSPRAFLSKEQRQLPRQDLRKGQLKKNIQHALAEAGNFREFEQKIKSVGYEILRGRGISFTDDNKVKIKGSEVGFSLAKIEKIFALKEQLKTGLPAGSTNPKIPGSAGEKTYRDKQAEIAQAFEKKDKESEQERREKIRRLLFPKQETRLQPDLMMEQTPHLTNEVGKQIADLIYGLMKPESVPEHLAPEWLKKKRKKKKPGYNL
jgi:hypothetical protein